MLETDYFWLSGSTKTVVYWVAVRAMGWHTLPTAVTLGQARIKPWATPHPPTQGQLIFSHISLHAVMSSSLFPSHISVKVTKVKKCFTGEWEHIDPNQDAWILQLETIGILVFLWISDFDRWAATRQNQQNYCAPGEDSDQPGHLPSLISLRCVLNG